MRKKLLSTMLALCVMLTALPMGVSATGEMPETNKPTAIEEKPEESESTTTTPSADEPQISDNNLPNTDTTPTTKQRSTAEAVPLAEDVPMWGENLTWKIEGDTVTIGGTGEINFMRIPFVPWWKPEIKYAIIENGITSIGKYAFAECSSLVSIKIPNSVTSIKANGIYNCGSLSSIEIPNSVTSIETGTFSGCPSLTSIKVEEGNPNYDSRNNCNAIIETSSNRLMLGCKNTKIPNSVTSIEVGAFGGCIGLTGIEIPDSVTSIGARAFSSCKSLTNIEIPDSITDIEDGTFAYCEGLTNIEIPSSVTSIGKDAFEGCHNLKKVNFVPNSKLTNIGDYAFAYSALSDITIPNGVKYIGNHIFEHCTQLRSVTIPKSIEKIGSYAFTDCYELSDVYYGGSEEDWQAIKFGEHNETLESSQVTIHYNSDHYDSDPATQYKVYCNGGYEGFNCSLENCITRTSSTRYNPQLAHMLIAMCNSVYSEDDMKKTFESFGFKKENSIADNNMNSIYLGYGMAKKQVGNKTFVLVVGRGTGNPYPWDDLDGWLSNIVDSKLNSDKLHSGFADAAKELYIRITSPKFLGITDFSNVNFVLTGFSRGAAAANILAAQLKRNGVAEKNIYAYTFACPDVGTAPLEMINNPHSSIFNIGNVNDFVSWVPGGVWRKFSDWNKYGQSYWYCEDWSSSQNQMGMDAHNQVKYLNYLRSERPVGSYKARTNAKSVLESAKKKRQQEFVRHNIGGRRITTQISGHCPVDIRISTSDGALIGTVIDNVANEIVSNKVYIDVEGDQKDIFLLDDDRYVVNIIGTGDGTMDYFVKNIDVDSWETLEEKTFANVAVNNGKKMVSYINPREGDEMGTDIPSTQLFVLGSDNSLEKEVLPDGNGTEVPRGNSNKPNDKPNVNDKPSIDSKPDNGDNTTNKPIFSEENKTDVSGTTTPNNSANGMDQKNKAPKTGDTIFNKWLVYLVLSLVTVFCMSFLRRYSLMTEEKLYNKTDKDHNHKN